MTFEVRLAVLVLAAFATVSLIASVLVPWIAQRITGARPRSLATALTTVRLLPAGAGLIAAAIVFASFVVFEERGDGIAGDVWMPVAAEPRLHVRLQLVERDAHTLPMRLTDAVVVANQRCE